MVDDEPLIQRTVERVLQREHDVTVAPGGEEALGHLEAGAEFDVILCDVSMPGLTGPELHRVLAERFPAAAGCTIFLTGGALDEPTLAYLDAAPHRPISKPFDVATLRARVRALLPE